MTNHIQKFNSKLQLFCGILQFKEFCILIGLEVSGPELKNQNFYGRFGDFWGPPNSIWLYILNIGLRHFSSFMAIQLQVKNHKKVSSEILRQNQLIGHFCKRGCPNICCKKLNGVHIKTHVKHCIDDRNIQKYLLNLAECLFKF